MTTSTFVPVRARRGPRIPEGTVRISKSGSDVSIPFELIGQALGKAYNYHTDGRVSLRPLVDEAARKLRFVVVTSSAHTVADAYNCRPYVTSSESRSVVVTCKTLLEKMGTVQPGRDYAVEIKGKEMTISFSKPCPRRK